MINIIIIWISLKDTLFQSSKFYLIQINHFSKSKKVFETNKFLRFNQIVYRIAVSKITNSILFYIIFSSLMQ